MKSYLVAFLPVVYALVCYYAMFYEWSMGGVDGVCVSHKVFLSQQPFWLPQAGPLLPRVV